VALTLANNGQSIAVRVGDQIEITLGTVGPKQYGEPLVSSAAVKLESTALGWPANPGGPTFIYIFDAAEAGEAQVTVPVINAATPEMDEAAKKLTFTATIAVRPAPGKQSGPPAAHVPYAARRLDQANRAHWDGAWINLWNDAQQTFTPSLPRLTGVEVDLVWANPAAEKDESGAEPSAELTLSLLDGEGKVLASVSKTVVGQSSHVLFALPNGGMRVTPGQTYRIGLKGGGGAFGWKYVAGGYANGAAFFNSKPLLKDGRATFLFRVFGSR
jgi:hypothetical protein